jgi:hypothetical protein
MNRLEKIFDCFHHAPHFDLYSGKTTSNWRRLDSILFLLLCTR